MPRFHPLHLRRGVWLATLVTTLLLALLLLGLAGCRQLAGGPPAPPHLLGVVKMPYFDGATIQGVLHPNGRFYVINWVGSVAVLEGPRLLELITFTVPADFRTDLYESARRPNLRDIAVDPQTGLVYVADQFLNVVHVISGTTVVTAITNVGVKPRLLAVHPQTGYLYVGNVSIAEGVAHSSNIAVVSGTQVLTRLPLSGLAYAMTINPVDQQLYVGHDDGRGPYEAVPPGGMLAVISGTHLVSDVMPIPNLTGGIYTVDVNRYTGELYMQYQFGGVIYWDGRQAAKYRLLGEQGYSLNTLAVDANRNWAYVASWDKPRSHVLVMQQDQVIATLTVGDDPRAIAVDATHDFVYVANHLSSDLTAIRGTEVVTTLATGGVGTSYITVDEQRGYIYVSNPDAGGSVSVFGFDQPVDRP